MQHHPVFARFYGWMSPRMEVAGLTRLRRDLLAGLSGEVVEVGAGNGLNFPHYPDGVTRVVAVEPEPHLRALARQAAARAPVQVDIVDGDASDLPARGGTFDAAVLSLVLCSVAEPDRVLQEVRRVLRAGGELRFLEHVRARTPGLARTQRVLDATVWPHLAGGCHTSRDSEAAIGRAGFAITRIDHFLFPETRIPLPTSPFIAGAASRPLG